MFLRSIAQDGSLPKQAVPAILRSISRSLQGKVWKADIDKTAKAYADRIDRHWDEFEKEPDYQQQRRYFDAHLPWIVMHDGFGTKSAPFMEKAANDTMKGESTAFFEKITDKTGSVAEGIRDFSDGIVEKVEGMSSAIVEKMEKPVPAPDSEIGGFRPPPSRHRTSARSAMTPATRPAIPRAIRRCVHLACHPRATRHACATSACHSACHSACVSSFWCSQ